LVLVKQHQLTLSQAFRCFSFRLAYEYVYRHFTDSPFCYDGLSVQHTYKIHFVCRGNTYRSRLAEAFVRELRNPHVHASSSGIEASNYNLYPLDYVPRPTGAIRKRFHLDEYFSPERTSTSNELLEAADLIVFMSPDIASDATHRFTFNPDKAVTWQVADVGRLSVRRGVDADESELRVAEAGQTARRLQTQCRDFISEITRLSWADVVDENNNPRGFRLPVNLIYQKGLWWRGCHIVVSLPNRKFLIEQRSDSIYMDPGMLDITLGGGVDTGEEPLQAAVREAKEELGLNLPANSLKIIDVRKWDAYHPRYKVNTKIFLYTFHARLSTNAPLLRIQKKEVAAVHTLTYRQILWLIRFHHLKRLGRLKAAYAYYRAIVAASRRNG
jgi:8-oxo-dGTP pyrophosphatase MutT (NUDIX family)